MWLAGELKERGLPLSNYSSVFRYVKGEREPSLEWVAAAADVFAVNPAWLAWGEPHAMQARSDAWVGRISRFRESLRLCLLTLPPEASAVILTREGLSSLMGEVG